jgi:hypothetical protein
LITGDCFVAVAPRNDRTKKIAPSFDEAILVNAQLENYDVGGLQTLRALFDGELNLLAFLQVLEAIRLDRGEVDENVRSAIAGDEAVTRVGLKQNGSKALL